MQLGRIFTKQLVRNEAWGPTLANVVFVGNFTQSTFGGVTTTVNGYVMYNNNGSLAVTLNPLLSATSVVRGIITSATTTTPSRQLIYGGTTATSGAFVYAVNVTTGATTQMNLQGLSPTFVGGFNGLASGNIQVSSSPTMVDMVDMVGLFNPSDTNSITSYWFSSDLSTWRTVYSNPANNGDTASGQGLFYRNGQFYMNAVNNSTNSTYFKYLDAPIA